ncbi:MAG TPA: ClpX C4-type zinc finger protein [Ktedonobacteraceae bacterium]|nr:ClpX C4-type zinc finger protein [Ktedonobacteraceae bacterium]
MFQHSSATNSCSFCGKERDKVQRLIAGPAGVCICDECIDLHRKAIEREWQAVQQRGETLNPDRKMITTCNSCGVTSPASHNYCFNCGQKLGQEP